MAGWTLAHCLKIAALTLWVAILVAGVTSWSWAPMVLPPP